ncbi:N-acetylmannosamine-6-phosphate 2-epimerase [Jeotgalibacillus haloalkalitolerans]|uniref:Putative N-acetylmannosamine-6-phosphate 2-epimerase n=1 Tax=Jeotgalibacillus haloalkalitolerans TaxID=3104292 RepID=A0ABU5KHL8_9BACL|nr:N-acetylmannosamine-6-phosphate 2-epimerase [Jeotgalibacillus sp. HH7-29]MDZ5710687.1 N-acetylmannosamine-6-phosphate 2-epimerase [Jeotgalibacillus sp. HH7-29]
MLEIIKKGLVVSCQALEDEPLYGSDTMKKMAEAARRGGAVAIRANGVEDIKAIKAQVNLPIIGIIKAVYPDSDVYITPTLKEVEALIEAGVDLIATDATMRVRPNHQSLENFIKEVKSRFPEQQWMADCATLEECIHAEELGFDCVGTTLHGYTKNTAGKKLYHDDFQFLKEVVNAVNIPVIAEGNIITPEMSMQALNCGAHSVVVGGAITRPQQITERFVAELKKI